MNPEPVAPAKLFLAIDGKPQGPHTAASVMQLWQEGKVTDETLICPDGGAAWVPLKEYASALRAELPPIPPAGYGSSARAAGAAAPAAAPPAVAAVTPAKRGDGTKGLRVSALVAALVFFFLPWLELRCQGTRMLYQSGVQSVINRGSVGELGELDALPGASADDRNPFDNPEFRDKTGFAVFAGVALLALVIGVAVAFRNAGRRMSGMLAAVALGMVGLEAIVGFPLERAVKKELRGGGLGLMGMGVPDMERPGMGFPGVGSFINVQYAPWFYAELAALGLAAVLGLRGRD